MDGSNLPAAILLFLFAAVVAVPVAQRLGIGAVLGYLLPALGLLLGAVIATVLFSGDLPAVLGAVLGLVTGLIVVRLASKRFSSSTMTLAVCPSTPFSGDPS